MPTTENLLRGFFQVGYATTDLDRAMAMFGDTFGISEFAQMRDLPAQAPHGGEMVASFALAYVGDTMIELIQPMGGDDAMLRDYLPDSGFAVRQHHLAYSLPTMADLEATEQALRNKGIDIVIKGKGMDIVDFFYADTRPQLGHYSEYIYLSEKGRDAYEQLPHY